MKEKMIGLWRFVKGAIGLVLSILVIMSFFGFLDDKEETMESQSEVEENEKDEEQEAGLKEPEDDKTAVESIAVNRNNTDIDAVLPDDPDYDKSIHVGGRYGLKGGGSMEVLDAGYGYGVVYVLVELTSGEEEGLQFDQSDATLYIDDYEVPMGGGEEAAISNGYIYVASDISYPTEASVNAGGRKANMVFVADISNDIPETAEIEFDISGGIFKINPLTTWKAQQNLNENMGISNEESQAGIGNPVIDANPDRYMPAGITGKIDGIDDGFYADSGNIDLVPGEYGIIGGGSQILSITENTISMIGGKNSFENAEIKPAENMAPQYWVYINGEYYAVVSFFDGGLYFRTYEEDGAEDWDEGFYTKF